MKQKTTLKTENQWKTFFRNCEYLTEYFKEKGSGILIEPEREILVEFAKTILSQDGEE